VSLKILIATSNPAKQVEYRRLLDGLLLELTTPAKEGLTGKVEETGDSFEENALLKARFYAKARSVLALSDDSGLEVDALNGGPGVHSARYGGAEANDEDRNRLVLSNMGKTPWDKRTARFRAVIALAWPDGREETFHGSCEGYIAGEPRGGNGFGYDPIFYYPELRKTFGEVAPDVKDRYSHRAVAAHKAAHRLRELSGVAPVS
jgi:XTP/dITP diphosphohydrolase